MLRLLLPLLLVLPSLAQAQKFLSVVNDLAPLADVLPDVDIDVDLSADALAYDADAAFGASISIGASGDSAPDELGAVTGVAEGGECNPGTLWQPENALCWNAFPADGR